eukprot:SAG31_NODE_36700_length_311_cov_0.726415_1_plen_28_part_10
MRYGTSSILCLLTNLRAIGHHRSLDEAP